MLASAVFLATVELLPSARAATPIAGAISAQAGAGGVTSGRFVKLASAGVIDQASAATDKIIGVCEITADANALTRYAPTGTMTTVTAGEAITVGDWLTADSAGKAVVVTSDPNTMQRGAAFALTAASDPNDDVTVVVLPTIIQQKLALSSAAIGGGYGDTGATISAAGVGEFNGALTTDGALTADNVVCTNAATFGGGYGATGLTISTAGVLQANGAVTTDGALTTDNIVCTNAATFGGGYGSTGLTISTAGVLQADGAITSVGAITSRTSLIAPGFKTGATTSDADSLAIPVTHAVVVKTTGADAEALTLANGTAGQLLTITLGADGGGDGTLTPTTATGFVAIVFADAGDTATLLYVDDTVGWIVVGTAGVAAPPVITIS
jgi:hypothetical protein